jgi:hypothetical protein
MLSQILAALVVVILFSYVSFGVSLAIRTGTIRYFRPYVFERKNEPMLFWLSLAFHVLIGMVCLYYAISFLRVFFA